MNFHDGREKDKAHIAVSKGRAFFRSGGCILCFSFSRDIEIPAYHDVPVLISERKLFMFFCENIFLDFIMLLRWTVRKIWTWYMILLNGWTLLMWPDHAHPFVRHPYFLTLRLGLFSGTFFCDKDFIKEEKEAEATSAFRFIDYRASRQPRTGYIVRSRHAVADGRHRSGCFVLGYRVFGIATKYGEAVLVVRYREKTSTAPC